MFGPNGKECAQRQQSRAKPRKEWIAVLVPFDESYRVQRVTVDRARERVRSRAHHYKESGRLWELAGGVLFCVHCGRRMSFASVKRRNGRRTAYYRCQGHRRNGHKEGCPNARHYRAIELEERVWRFVYGLLTDPDRLRRGLDAMIEEKRKALRGNTDKELGMWLDRIADADRKRSRAQDLSIEGLLSPEELRAKLSDLEKTRETARSELEALKGRKEEVEVLERDREALLESYTAMVPKGLDHFTTEDRRWAYGRIRLNVFAGSDGSLVATWALTKDISVICEDTHQDEARKAYERGIGQSEKFGHSGMAEDLRLALIQLNE